MNTRLWTISLAVLVLHIVGLTTAQYLFFEHSLADHQRWAACLVQKTIGRVAAHALQTNDDLILQEVIQGLSQSPGIVFSCITNTEGVILAHTQAAKMGQILKKPASTRGLWTGFFPDTIYPKGELIFQWSSHQDQQWRDHQKGLLLALGLLTVLNMGGLCATWQWVLKKETCRVVDLLAAQKEYDHTLLRWQELCSSLQKTRNIWMQSAAEKINGPRILLDERQRIVVVNNAASQLFGQSLEALRGLSWQQVPFLSSLGNALQSSLETTGQTFSVPIPDHTVTIQILSEKTSDGDTLTWITPQRPFGD